MKKNAIIFLAWDDRFINEVRTCISRSYPFIGDYDLILITDEYTATDQFKPQITKVIRANFELSGLLRKTEILRFLPNTYESFLFLDSDTVVIGDVSLGFNKAGIHGIAACPAPHYSLDAFWGFDRVMRKEGVLPLGQLQYNTGVIFFKNSPEVKEVFTKWGSLALENLDFTNDQPFFTLAMDLLGFNPYTLSISYNYRAFGEAISGDVRIWHSHGKMPVKINEYSSSWPPRRAWPERLEFASTEKYSLVSIVKQKIKRLIRRCPQRR